MRRILPIQWPIERNTVGNSFGPIAISATMPMTTISPQPRPNMNWLAYNDWARRLGAHALGATLGFRLRRAGGIDGLDRLGLYVGGLFVFRHAFLEGLNALSEVAHQRRNF